MYPKNRQESPTKTCPVCQKEVAARGYNSHIRLAHTILPKEARASTKKIVQAPLDFSSFGSTERARKPSILTKTSRSTYSTPTSYSDEDVLKTVLTIVGVGLVLKWISYQMDEKTKLQTAQALNTISALNNANDKK